MGQSLHTNKKVSNPNKAEDSDSVKPRNVLEGDGYKELDPIQLFGLWFDESFKYLVEEPFYMSLCTVSSSGRPSARIVSLGRFDENGFYFSTTETANKVKQLEDNPYACANFYWHKVQRTVRIEGKAHEVDRIPNDNFKSLPKEVKISVSASPTTSVPVKDGEWQPFLENYEKIRQQYNEGESDDIPRPEFLKDYIIVPNMIEFMQVHDGKPNDRIQFTRSCDGEPDNLWTIRRLFP